MGSPEPYAKFPIASDFVSSSRRTLRVVRLLRAGRLLISVPEIYILMSLGFE